MEKRINTDRIKGLGLVIFMVSTFAVLIGGYKYYLFETGRIRSEKYQELAAIGKLKAGQIEQWRQERLDDVSKSSRAPLFKQTLQAWLRDKDDTSLRAKLQERLTVEGREFRCADVLLLDTDSRVLLSTDPQPLPLSSEAKKTIEQALVDRTPALSDLYRNEQGAVWIDAVGPVLGADGRPIAVSVLRSSAQSVLYPLIQSWPIPSKTGETLLVRRDGDRLLFLNDLRHRPGVALSLTESLSFHDLPGVQAILGKQGMFVGKDYRGVEVLADLRHIPNSPWFMVAELDTSEILEEAKYRGGVVILFSAVFILLAATATALGYRYRQAGMYKTLYRAEREQRLAQEEFRTTLYSIGDAVITTDTAGTVKRMNPVAEHLTGWRESEARGMPLERVFHIMNEDSGVAAENPVSRVLREGKVIGLANHTVLIAKDGTENPIADSGAPILDEGGDLTGVVLVFRDQTAERQAQRDLEESEERYRTVADHIYDWELWISPDGSLKYCSPSSERVTGYLAEEYVHDATLLNRIVHPDDRLLWEQHLLLSAQSSDKCELDYRIIGRDGEVTWIAHHCSSVYSSDGKLLGRRLSNREVTDRKRAELALERSERWLRLAQEAASAGTWEWDLLTSKSFWSDELWILYGLSPHSCETSFEKWLETIHPDDRAQVKQVTQLAVSNGTELNVEWRTNDGKNGGRWLMSRGRPIRDASGRVTRYIGIAVDITDRKRSEEALRSSERKYADFAEFLPQMVYEMDLDGRFTFINRYGLESFGYSAEDLAAGISAFDFLVPEERRTALENAEKIKEAEDLVVTERTALRKDGSTFQIITYSAPVIRDGSVVGVRGICIDVTDRKKSEEALKDSEDRYRQLVEMSPDVIGIHQDGKIVFMNSSGARILGAKSPDELLGKSIQEVLHSDYRQIVTERLQRMLKGEKGVFPAESLYVKPDGTVFPVEATASPLIFKGRPAVQVVARDITARKMAEEALRESEQRYRTVADFTHDWEYWVDADGRFLYVSPSCERMTGYTAKEFLDDPELLDRIIHPDDRADYAVHMCTARESDYDRAHKVDFRIVHRDGETVWIGHACQPVYGHEGQPLGRRASNRDITDRKNWERALQESERRYKAVFNIASVGIDLVDRQGKFLEVNGALALILGYAPQELQRLTILDVTYPEDVDRSRELHEAMLRGEIDDYRFEKRYVRKDGATIWSDTAVSAIRDADGQHRATVGVIRDITSQKKSEEARIRLATAVEQAVDGIVITDIEGTIQYVNPAYETITGYSRDEAIGLKPTLLRGEDEELATQQGIIETLSHRERWSGHLVKKRKDGETYEEDVTVAPVLDPQGKTVNFVIIKRDVTKEASLQKQLLQAQKMEAIGTLAGGVAHDFNNILQVALGYSELLLSDEQLSTRSRSDLQKVYDSAKRGADLVQRLLTFSRKAEIKPQPLNLNRRITDLRKMLERTIPKMVQIELVLDKGIFNINADPTQLDQVLMNLAVNARDAMPDGGRLIIKTTNIVLDEEYARTHLEASPGQYVLLTVSDNGSGMDKETLEHVFEPFYTTKGQGEGTGLGLATVHGIMKQHGGHIRCYSELGHGTVFRIYFPALMSDEELEQVTVGEMPPGGSETILLVEDEELIRGLGSRILTKAGYNVITASNGKEALEVYQMKSEQIDLVVLDLIMPEMGGKKCLEALSKFDSSVMVVIASGYSANAMSKESLVSAAKGFVDKPYNIRQMLAVVRDVLDAE